YMRSGAPLWRRPHTAASTKPEVAMERRRSVGWAVRFCVAVTLMAAAPAAAQQAAPVSPLFGPPNTASAMRLAPILPPPSPTPAEKLPLDKLKVAKGFKGEIYMSGVGDVRSMSECDKGTR